MQTAVGDLLFDVDDSGPRDGPAVLLLHGFPQNRSSWSDVVPSLNAAGLRTVAPDQRGYSDGARPAGADQYTLTHLVADALGVLRSLGIERAHVVGHDWGAVVAWYLAARHPEQVLSLTALAFPHPDSYRHAFRNDPEQKAGAEYMDFFTAEGTADLLTASDGAQLREAFAEDGGGLTDEQVDRYTRFHIRPGVLDAALNWYRAGSLFDDAPLGAVTVPTTYLWSTADSSVSRAAAEGTADHVTGPYRFRALEGATHWQPEQRPGTVAEEILRRTRAHD